MEQIVEKRPIRLKVRKYTFKRPSKNKAYIVHMLYLPSALYTLLDSPTEFEVQSLNTEQRTITLKAIKKSGGENT